MSIRTYSNGTVMATQIGLLLFFYDTLPVVRNPYLSLFFLAQTLGTDATECITFPLLGKLYRKERGYTTIDKEESGMSFEQKETVGRKRLPTNTNEDVEFSESLADENDHEAAERAEAADSRQRNDR